MKIWDEDVGFWDRGFALRFGVKTAGEHTRSQAGWKVAGNKKGASNTRAKMGGGPKPEMRYFGPKTARLVCWRKRAPDSCCPRGTRQLSFRLHAFKTS